MTSAILPLLQHLRQVTLLRYLAASVGALAVDMGTFLAALELGAPPLVAATLGYALGIVAHWLLSSRKVFADLVATDPVARTRQKTMFVASALVGLALTNMVVGLGSGLGVDPRLAKLAAIVVSFTATWLLRKSVVFR